MTFEVTGKIINKGKLNWHDVMIDTEKGDMNIKLEKGSGKYKVSIIPIEDLASLEIRELYHKKIC